MLKFISMILLSGFFLAQTTHATPPSVESINQLIQLNGEAEACQIAMKEVKENAYEEFTQVATAEQKKMNGVGFEQSYQYLSEARKLADDYLQCEPLQSLLIQSYTETLTQEEINYLINRYKNPLFKKTEEKLLLKDENLDKSFNKYVAEFSEKESNLIEKYFKSKP